MLHGCIATVPSTVVHLLAIFRFERGTFSFSLSGVKTQHKTNFTFYNLCGHLSAVRCSCANYCKVWCLQRFGISSTCCNLVMGFLGNSNVKKNLREV